MDREEALDIIPVIAGVVEKLSNSTDRKEVSEILVDASLEFKAMHPLEKEASFIYLLGQVAEKNY